MARAKLAPGTMNRVHRPHLTAQQQALAAQYRPNDDCRCGQEGREWLMESPRDGKNLEFYCSNCGHFTIVPRA